MRCASCEVTKEPVNGLYINRWLGSELLMFVFCQWGYAAVVVLLLI